MTGYAVAQHGDLGAHAVVVRPFDLLDAVEAIGITPERQRLARRDRRIALDGVRLHRGDGEDAHAEADVRDRHADDRARQRQPAPQAIDGIEQRGQDDPDAEHHADRREPLAGPVDASTPAPGPAASAAPKPSRMRWRLFAELAALPRGVDADGRPARHSGSMSNREQHVVVRRAHRDGRHLHGVGDQRRQRAHQHHGGGDHQQDVVVEQEGFARGGFETRPAISAAARARRTAPARRRSR